MVIQFTHFIRDLDFYCSVLLGHKVFGHNGRQFNGLKDGQVMFLINLFFNYIFRWWSHLHNSLCVFVCLFVRGTKKLVQRLRPEIIASNSMRLYTLFNTVHLHSCQVVQCHMLTSRSGDSVSCQSQLDHRTSNMLTKLKQVL